MHVSKFFYLGLKNGREQIIYANPWTVHTKDLEKALFSAVYSDQAYPDGLRLDLYDLAKKLLETKLIYFNPHYCTTRNVLNKTPFHYAIEKNNKPMQDLLIAHDVNCDEPLPHVDPLHEAACQDNLEQMKSLIEAGTDPNLIFTSHGPLPYKLTTLHIAVYENHFEMVHYLLNIGANQQIFNKDTSLLHVAVNNNAINIAKLLLDNQAHVNQQTGIFSNTPLHLAVNKNFIEMANLLLEYDANINLQNNNGYTPLDIAAEENNTQMVRCLLCAPGLDIQQHKPLCSIVEHGLSETMKCLLCIPNIQVDGYFIGYKKTALYYALAKDELFYQSINILPSSERDKKIIELVKALLDAGATLPNNYSPLHIAIENDHSPEVIQALLDKGIDVNKKAGYLDQTALHLAAESNNSEHIKLLLAHGANPNIENKNGKTALTITQEKKHPLNFFLIAEYIVKSLHKPTITMDHC